MIWNTFIPQAAPSSIISHIEISKSNLLIFFLFHNKGIDAAWESLFPASTTEEFSCLSTSQFCQMKIVRCSQHLWKLVTSHDTNALNSDISTLFFKGLCLINLVFSKTGISFCDFWMNIGGIVQTFQTNIDSISSHYCFYCWKDVTMLHLILGNNLNCSFPQC